MSIPAHIRKLTAENAALKAELESESAWARDYLAQYQAEHARNLNLKAALRELRLDPYTTISAHFCKYCEIGIDDPHAPDCPWLKANELLDND